MNVAERHTYVPNFAVAGTQRPQFRLHGPKLIALAIAFCASLAAKPASATTMQTYSGTVQSGPQSGALPMYGGTIALYDAPLVTSSAALPSTPLGTATLLASSNSFSITLAAGQPTCEANSYVYALASGGTTTKNGSGNAKTVMSVMLGPCNPTSGLIVPGIVINEATTVAMVSAFANFIDNSTNVYYFKFSTKNVNIDETAAIGAAWANYGTMIQASTGNITLSSDIPDQGKLVLLSDLLASCTVTGAAQSANCITLGKITAPLPAVESTTSGGNGYGSPATAASGYADVPADTFGAMLNIAHFATETLSTDVYNQAGTANVTPYGTVPSVQPPDMLVRVLQKVANPSISISSGMVTITTSTVGAQIGYTFAMGPQQLYTGPFLPPGNGNVIAQAVENGMQPSDTRSKYISGYASSGSLVDTTGAPFTAISNNGNVQTAILQLTSASNGTSCTIVSQNPSIISAASPVIISGSVGTVSLTPKGVGVAVITANCGSVANATASVRSTNHLGGMGSKKTAVYGLSSIGTTSWNSMTTQQMAPQPAEHAMLQLIETGFYPNFNQALINVTWYELEKSPGNYDFSSITSALTNIATAKANGTHPYSNSVTGKIRVFAGNNVPQFLTTTTTGTVGSDLQSNGGTAVTTGNSSVLVGGLWWSSDYEARFHALLTALAAEYDIQANITEVGVSSCASSTGEPLILPGSLATSTVSGIPSAYAQGFSDASFQQCLENTTTDYADWVNTPLDSVYTPLALQGDSTLQVAGSTAIALRPENRPGFALAAMNSIVQYAGPPALTFHIGNQDLNALANLEVDPTSTTGSPAASYVIYRALPVAPFATTPKVVQMADPTAVETEASPRSGCIVSTTSNICYDPAIVDEGIKTVGVKEVELWDTSVGGGSANYSTADTAAWSVCLATPASCMRP